MVIECDVVGSLNGSERRKGEGGRGWFKKRG